MKLSDLAVVRTGLVLARKQAKIENDIVQKYKQLNLRSINEKGYIDMDLVETFCANERLRAEYLTQFGDLVVRLTAPYTAVIIDDETAGMVIPSHFIVIRTSGKKILPEYLYWLLNTDKVKSTISQNITSTMIGTVKPAYFMEFEVELIPIEEQRKIAQLYLLSKKELHLLEKLMEQKKLYYKQAINKVQKEMRGRSNENN